MPSDDAQRAADIANAYKAAMEQASPEDHLREVAKVLGHIEATAEVYGPQLDQLGLETKAGLLGDQQRELARAQLHGFLALGKLHGAVLVDDGAATRRQSRDW